jgi:hypothetical protein
MWYVDNISHMLLKQLNKQRVMHIFKIIMEENLNTENPMQKYAWQLKTMSHIHSLSLTLRFKCVWFSPLQKFEAESLDKWQKPLKAFEIKIHDITVKITHKELSPLQSC